MGIGAVAEPEGGVAAPNERTDLLAERRAHPQLHARVGHAEALQAAGEGGAGQRSYQGQGDGATLQLLKGPDGVEAVAHGGQQGLRVGLERLAGLGEDHPARHALEQPRAQLTLEQLQASTHRGLGEVQDRRRPCEATTTDYGHELLDLVELHGPSAYLIAVPRCMHWTHRAVTATVPFRRWIMPDNSVLAGEILRHGAYVCVRLADGADARAVAGVAIPALVEKLGLENEFAPRAGPPAQSIAFLRRRGATPGAITDDEVLQADAVVHVAAPTAQPVTDFCTEAARLLGPVARLRLLGGVVRPKP